MDSQEQIQDQGETPTTASSEQSGRPVLTRTPKPRPFGGKLRIEIENRSVEPKKELAEEQKQEQNHKEKELSQDGLRLELEEKKSESSMRLEISSPRSGEKPPTGLRLKEQTAAASGTSKPRPFGGKLKIDVEAAELVAPPVIVSPLGYYPSKRLPSNTREDHPASMFSGAESFAGSSFLSRAPPFLEYGMIVSLVCDDRGGLVAAEGFASRDVRLERLNYGVGVSMPNRLGLGGLEERDFFAEGGFRLLTCPFHDCLFEIVPKMTYDATIALKLLVGQSPRLSKKQHTIDNLRFKSEAEGRLNAMMYKKLKGRQVIYGQTIQLRHKKSGKYLSLDSSPMSFRGSEYAPVFLDSGGPSSHFNVLPRFKLRSKGSPVLLTDQMIFTGGTEARSFNLFVSNRNATDGVSVGVVGSSVHSSQWRAVHYDSLGDESFVENGDVDIQFRSEDGLRAGSCIRLFHLESSSWLSFNSTGPGEPSMGVVTLQYSDESDQENDTKKALSSDSLWEVEHVSVFEGGQIKWREGITLRHLLTGKYLAITQHQSPRATSRAGAVARLPSHTCAQAITTDHAQAFCLVPTAIADENIQIEDGDVLLIQHLQTSSFLHSIDTHASSMADIRLSSKPLRNDVNTNSKGTNSGGASFTVAALHGARDEDAFKLVAVSQFEVTDTLLLVSYKRALKQFLIQFDAALLGGDYPNFQFCRDDTVAVFRGIERVLADLVAFCTSVMDGSIDQLRSRQNLFRTHQYIELLITMIKAPFQSYGGPFSIDEVCSHNDEYMESSRDPGNDKDELEMRGSPVRQRTDSSAATDWINDSSNTKGLISPRRSISSQHISWRRKSTAGGSVSSSRSETHAAAMQSLNRVIPAINMLLLHISWENRTNELYAVKVAMPVLMELLGNGFQTSLPLSYLLRENRNLVESITAFASIIRNFFELIATRGKSIRYMQFLVALCTSRGKGIPKTQEAICELLFNPANRYRDDVIVPIRPSDNGFEICMLSRLTSSETNHDIEAMFNRSVKRKPKTDSSASWMPLAKFYEEYYVNGKHRALGQYCYGLFRLYVSLCLDRNYVSIEYVQAAFPRENLLKSVVDTHLSRSLRAVMMDLLRVAYVDCEPQKTMSCPNYTRIWTDIGAMAMKTIPGLQPAGYSPEDLVFFASLKECCCSYFDHLQGAITIDEIPENELTLAILRVSRNMVEFGMYDTEDEISRLVVQILDLLDERTDCVVDILEGNNVDYSPRKSFYAPASLSVSSTQHLRSESAPLNSHGVHLPTVSQTSQQRTVSSAASGKDRRTGWGITAHPPTHLQNSVLFDGAGAMSSIRICKERDVSKQYTSVTNEGIQASPTDDNNRFSARAHHNPHRHFNRLPLHKPEMQPTCSINVHEMNEVNRVVMEIKDEICAILLFVDQIRVDYLISTLLASFQARYGGPPSSVSPRYRDQDTNQMALLEDTIMRETAPVALRGLETLPHVHNYPDKVSPLAMYLFGAKSLECKLSLSRIGQRAVTTIFMQMLMYEYPPLVSKALELLLQQYNQHDQFLKEMQSVQLLITEETITTYNTLKGDVDELRRLAETTEVWMDLTSRSDFERASSVCQLLKSLVSIVEETKVGHPVSLNPKSGGPRGKLGVCTSGKPACEDESNDDTPGSGADLLATNAKTKCTQQEVLIEEENARKPTQHLAVEKQPPNRKLKEKVDLYVLNPSIGRASRFSSSHQVLPPLSEKLGVAGLNSKNDGQTIAAEARRLLRNLRAAQFVLNMLTDGAHFYEGHLQQGTGEQQIASAHSPGSPTTRSKTKLQRRQRDQIRAVFGQAMQFLCVFCMGDAENQALVAPHATTIAHYVAELPVAQKLLVAVYADNFPLYKAVPTELINTFVGRLINDGPDPRYLFFLETLVLCNEQPVVENQLLVLFQLIKSLENAKVLQIFDDAMRAVEQFGDLLEQHTYLLNETTNNHECSQFEAFRTDYSPTTSDLASNPRTVKKADATDAMNCIAATSKMLEYHVRLLHLFAACATGKNTRVQEICQQILPLMNVLDILRHKDCTEGVQLALLRFLDQVYFTADDIETPGIDDLLQVMMILVQICEKRVIEYLLYIQVLDTNRQATLSLRKNKSKMGKRLELSAQYPTESPPLYLVIFSLIPTLYSFVQQFSGFFDSSEEAQYYLLRLHDCVALLLTVCASSKWGLSEDIVSNFEDFVYVMDKCTRANVAYQVQISTSLEQLWLMSLKHQERLNCLSLNCEQELSTLLQWAINKRAKEMRIASFQDVKNDDQEPSTFAPAIKKIFANSARGAIATGDEPSLQNQFGENKLGMDGFRGVLAAECGLEDMSSTSTATSTRLDTIHTRKPVAWGEKDSTDVDRRSNAICSSTASPGNVIRRSFSTFGASEWNKSRGLLHRLSPRRYYKSLRLGKSEVQHGSPKKDTAVTPWVSPDRYRPTDVSSLNGAQLNEGLHSPGRQQQHFSELGQLLNWLQNHPRVKGAMRDELNLMVQGILGIENSTKEEHDPRMHVRNVNLSFDLVVTKLVAHVEALQHSSYLKTNLTLLNVFCRMIYAIEDADERHNMQTKMSQLGVTRLVVQLIASRDNDALFASSIEVGVALLDGMNAEVQESFSSYWAEPVNVLFFERIQERIEKACKLIHSLDRASDIFALSRDDAFASFNDVLLPHSDVNEMNQVRRRHSIFGLDFDTTQPDKVTTGATKSLGAPIISIFRFLQLLCEGHFLNAQRALIAQPHASVSANLVETTTSFLLDTYLALTDLDIGLITQLFETITEYCQGPCVEAQETVANYKFISAVNALLTHSYDQRDAKAHLAVHQLRASIVITLLSLLEGRSDRALHTQLVQELNFEALKMNLMDVYVYFLNNYDTYAGNSKCSEDYYLSMGFNIYILLQQLADQHPQQAWWIPSSENESFARPHSSPRNSTFVLNEGDNADSPLYREAFHFFQSNCAKVEVVWDHHRSPVIVHLAPFPLRDVNERDSVPKVNEEVGAGGDVHNSSSGNAGTLIPFYFPVHPICFCLTEKSKEKLVWGVSRGGDKLSDFYARSDKLVDEMMHQSHLQYHYYVSWVAKKSEQIKRVAFALAVGINLIVLLFYRAAGVDSKPYAESQVTLIQNWKTVVDPPPPSLWIDGLLTFAGTLQILLYSVVLICYLLNSAPLIIKKGWKRRHRREQTKLSKRSAHSMHRRTAENKERVSFRDTEHLLRSLREREEEYNYLFLPPPIRKRSAPSKPDTISSRAGSSVVPVNVTSAQPSRISRGGLNGINDLRERIRLQVETICVSIYFLFRSPRVIYSLLQILISILGSYVNKLYFAFLLLDVVDRYKELNNVLRSISRPIKALGVTTLLYLIVVYVFAVVGFFFFREDYTSGTLTKEQREGRSPYTCQRLFQCFLVSLDQGLKSDGGLGTALRQLPLGETVHSYARLTFDVSYNILLVVLLLNLVFGVIIDTFASLRTDDQEKKLDMLERCFICSIDAYTFDRATKLGFHDHILRDHNMWHYLYLFVHIRKKNITDYNGLELFLAMRMAKKDMSFFPTHRALSLTHRGDFDDSSDVDSSTHVDTHSFYSGTSYNGSRRNGTTPLSPRTSLGSGTTPSRSSSEQRRLHERSAMNFYATPGVRTMGYFGSSIPGACRGLQTIDHGTSGKLERIEATIATLARVQSDMKEAQRRADAQHSELLAIISKAQNASLEHSSTPVTSPCGSPPSMPRRPSIRASGSSTPRIFTFESVTGGLEDESSNVGSPLPSPEANMASASSSVASSRSIQPESGARRMSANITTLAQENRSEKPSTSECIDTSQNFEMHWSESDVPPAASPQDSSRSMNGNTSLSFRFDSDEIGRESLSSSESLAECSPGIANSILLQTSPQRSAMRKPRATPRTFTFDLDSFSEEHKKDNTNVGHR